MYFDQDTISLVKLEAAYGTNEQAMVLNADDLILAEEAASTDPFMDYVILGDTVADGILVWLRFGVNPTYTRTISASATIYEDGGKINDTLGAYFPGG